MNTFSGTMLTRETVDYTWMDMLTHESWMDYAACLEVDPELWFPEKGPQRSEIAKAAKRICATCPVRPECLDYAVDGKERFGIWGGEGRHARDRIRRGAA